MNRKYKPGIINGAAFLALLTSPLPQAADGDPQAVAALGRIEPRGGIIRVTAASTPEAISGTVLAVLHVAEGDAVTAGQLLASTDSEALVEAKVNTAQSELQQALRTAEAAQARAEETCVMAEVEAREAARRSDLLTRNLASEEETEQAQGIAKAGAASCTAAHANARVADAAIEVARAHLVQRKAELERTRIKAPMDGRVIDITAHPGELVGFEGFLEMARADQMLAVAEVYETDIRHVRIGQKAVVSSDVLAFDLTGTVESIALKVNKQDEIGTDPAARKDARIIEVDILLDDPEPVRDLINLQVEIIIKP